LITVAIVFAVVLAIAPYFGMYMGQVYLYRPAIGDRFLLPVESAIYRLLGTSPRHSMRAREYLISLLLVSLFLIVWLYLWFTFQQSLPDNPIAIPNMPWDLGFHSAASFTTNTDFVHFSSEPSLSQGTILFAIQIALFLSAASGLAVVAAFIRGFARKDGTIGNFYVDIVRTMTRILVPLAFLGAILLVLFGVPETLAAYVIVHPLGGGTQMIPIGPVASFQSISLLGTNGGGFYSANAGSPFANPSEASNLFQIGWMLLIPISTPFLFSAMVRRPGEALPYLGTILLVLLVAIGLFLAYQSVANPDLAISQVSIGSNGYPVGQETRFSLASGSAFQVVSVYANVGANNLAIGSVSPVGQLVLLFGMFTQSTPGGEGTGFGTLLIYALMAIFVGGLMVGRTPEYLGKKIGQQQIRWAALVLFIHPVLILVPTALATLGGFVPLAGPTAPTGASTAYIAHSFTNVLYEFTSESANNGSAMGYSDNTLFLNLAGGVVMLAGRFLPILAMISIGGQFAEQETSPPGPGTIQTRSLTFTLYLAFFVIVLTGLLFLPVMALGPLSQQGF
jgi:potassium-transporting ATPase potassium-binding subunit